MMRSNVEIVDEVPNLYRIIRLETLRRTPGVSFDFVPVTALGPIAAVDRVIHAGGAISPGPVGDVERPWYMHPCQADNLIVLHGTRYVDIYTPEHGRVESFTVSPDRVETHGRTVAEGAAILIWSRRVFHRIRSCEKAGSASLNLAVHYDGFDIRTNFNVYDLDPSTGRHTVLREGHLDQPQ